MNYFTIVPWCLQEINADVTAHKMAAAALTEQAPQVSSSENRLASNMEQISQRYGTLCKATSVSYGAHLFLHTLQSYFCKLPSSFVFACFE